MLVKILGGIDIAAAIAFLMLIFGMKVFYFYLMFCAVLLLLKGMFVIGGDILSIVDLFSAGVLFISLFFNVFPVLLWAPMLLLLAKGLASLI